MTVLDRAVYVRIGGGKCAHIFQPIEGANAKAMALRSGESAFDRTVCGAGGEMWPADDDLVACKSCEAKLASS